MTTDRPARALILDFNGTVSHDEHIVLELFQELFAEHGRPLDAATYERELAGMSDPEIVWAWLGRDHPAVEQVIAERDRRYRARTADGSTIPPQVREAVRLAAEHVPVAICSGAARSEIEATLAAAEIADVDRADRGRRGRRRAASPPPTAIARRTACSRRTSRRATCSSSRTPRWA